jgi:hypothetical protein
MPIDRTIFELCNALVEDIDDNVTTVSTSKKIENLFYITVIVFCGVVIYYTFFTGGDGGVDLSNLRRIIPEEPPKISINEEGEFFVSLLDEKTNVDANINTATSVAGPIISKH